MQSWSIIIFCYNEVNTISQMIDKCYATIQNMGVNDYEIIVVDDGSSDGSKSKIIKQQVTYPDLIVKFHAKNLGIGHALRTGYATAKNENICAVPADGQFDLDELIPFSEIIGNTIISFYRKENTTYNFFRNSLSKANKQINLWLNGFELKDVNWVKIYKNEGIQKMSLEIESSLIESEICAKFLLMKYEVKEVESKYLQRNFGVSKGSSLKIISQAMRDTLYLWQVLRRFKNRLN